MAMSAACHKIERRDCELACAPINSEVRQEALGAMRAAINCALANRQIITHQVWQAFGDVLPQANLSLLYDVSHNTCRVEEHLVDGRPTRLCRPAMTFVFSWRGVPKSSYAERGHRHGYALDDWLEAEREILSQIAPV